MYTSVQNDCNLGVGLGKLEIDIVCLTVYVCVCVCVGGGGGVEDVLPKGGGGGYSVWKRVPTVVRQLRRSVSRFISLMREAR